MGSMGRQLILMLVLIVAIGAYVTIQGARLHSAEARAAAAEKQSADLTSALAEARGATKVVTKYVDRVRIVRERAATITKEIPVYVTAEADSRCAVPVGFVRLHDAAAENRPADPAGNPDAPAEGLALSAVAETVAGNYAACHENAAQVTALQEYIGLLLAYIDGLNGARTHD